MGNPKTAKPKNLKTLSLKVFADFLVHFLCKMGRDEMEVVVTLSTGSGLDAAADGPRPDLVGGALEARALDALLHGRVPPIVGPEDCLEVPRPLEVLLLRARGHIRIDGVRP